MTVCGLATWGVDSAEYRAACQRHGIAPYVVGDSGQCAGEIVRRIDLAIHDAHGPDYRVPDAGGKEAVAAASLVEYASFLRRLKSVPRVRFVTHLEASGRCSDDRSIRCALRHDVDADIGTALAMAQLERRLGVPSTYALLHTAPYYGSLDSGVFLRHGTMAGIYREIADAGHEIALHADPLHLFQHAKMDGAVALRSEVAWLRSQGMSIRGSIAHNSPSVYGIGNQAVFGGHLKPSPLQTAENAPQRRPESDREIVFNGNWSPLQVLDAGDLGLAYEGNDLLSRPGDGGAKYVAVRGVDWWFSADSMVRDWGDARVNVEQGKSTDEILEDIAGLADGVTLFVNVHPEFYSARANPELDRESLVRRRAVALNRRIGWTTYLPSGLEARCGRRDGEPEFQSFHIANGLGMLDLPEETTADGRLRIAVLGGANVDGASIHLPAHLHRRLARQIEQRLGFRPAIRKLSHPGMGLARLYPWIEHVCDEWRPHVVVVGIGADEFASSDPETGAGTPRFRAWAPPGDYLKWRDGELRVIGRSRLASFLPRSPWRTSEPGSLFVESQGKAEGRCEAALATQARCRHIVDAVRSRRAEVILLVEECGETSGVWHAGATAVEQRHCHEAFRSVLDPLAHSLGVSVADPYPLFLERPGPSGCHWTSVAEWNYRGHRLAARALEDAILDVVGTRDQDAMGWRAAHSSATAARVAAATH